MGGRFWVSSVVAFILMLLTGFVVHGMLLRPDYMTLPNLMRTDADAQGHFLWMILAHALMGLGYTWIYLKGRDAGQPPVAQGLRFGAALAIAFLIPNYLIYYAVQPWPGAIVVKQIVFDTIGLLVMGVVVALVNQGPKRA